MTTSAKISVIVPTYNQGRYLGACLDSIWFQDYPNLEIIVVDDCSTDETPEVIRYFEQSTAQEQASFASCYDEKTQTIRRTVHPRYPQGGRELVLMRNEQNMGSTRTYNRGFRAAAGEYCTYIASDDACHPSMLSTLAAPLDRDEADFVYSDMFIVDDDGRILRKFALPDYSFENSFLDWYLCGVSKLYRRSLHDAFGFYNEDFLANDHELYLRFALDGVRFLHIPKVLYSVRTHDRREENVHSPSNWSRLLKESVSLVEKARQAKSEGIIS